MTLFLSSQLVLLDWLSPPMKASWSGMVAWRYIGMENGVQCATKKISQGCLLGLLVGSSGMRMWSVMEPQSNWGTLRNVGSHTGFISGQLIKY